MIIFFGKCIFGHFFLNFPKLLLWVTYWKFYKLSFQSTFFPNNCCRFFVGKFLQSDSRAVFCLGKICYSSKAWVYAIFSEIRWHKGVKIWNCKLCKQKNVPTWTRAPRKNTTLLWDLWWNCHMLQDHYDLSKMSQQDALLSDVWDFCACVSKN